MVFQVTGRCSLSGGEMNLLVENQKQTNEQKTPNQNKGTKKKINQISNIPLKFFTLGFSFTTFFSFSFLVFFFSVFFFFLFFSSSSWLVRISSITWKKPPNNHSNH